MNTTLCANRWLAVTGMLVALSACSNATVASHDDAGSDTARAGSSCASASLRDCRDGCTALYGRRFFAVCGGPLEFVGCHATGCEDVYELASDPSGAEWVLSSGCPPKDWLDRGRTGSWAATPCPDAGDPCSSYSESECFGECEKLGGRPIMGDCAGPTQFVGCHLPGCHDSYELASDPSGAEWVLHSACIPEGWTDRGITGTWSKTCAEADAGGP